MSSVNRVILLGNLGKDPEIRHLENGKSKATFSLATNESYKNKEGEKITNTEWHNIVLWSPLANIAEKFLTRGKQIYIEGKLTNRSYTDKEGQQKYITEIIGQNLILLSGKENSNTENKDSELFFAQEENDSSDGLPF